VPVPTNAPPPPPVSTAAPLPSGVIVGGAQGVFEINLAPPVGSVAHSPSTTIFDIIAQAVDQPGLSASSPIRVTNPGVGPFRYTLTTTGVPATGTANNRLFTDPVNGLQLRVTRTAGVVTSVIHDGPINVTDLDMNIVVQPGDADEVMLQIRLPLGGSGNNNEFQGAKSDISFKWTATEVPPN
jgi:hypothetical protein